MRSTVTVRRAAGGPALLLRVRCAVHCAFPLIARHSALSRYLSGTLGLRPRLLGQVCVCGERIDMDGTQLFARQLLQGSHREVRFTGRARFRRKLSEQTGNHDFGLNVLRSRLSTQNCLLVLHKIQESENIRNFLQLCA